MEELERLESEVLEMNNCNIFAIFNYLKTRNDLYEKFKNKEKSMKQMWTFICDKARPHQIDNVAMINDRLVYLWAITYFSKSNEELGIKDNKINANTSTKVLNENKNKKLEVKNEEKELSNNQVSLFGEAKN